MSTPRAGDAVTIGSESEGMPWYLGLLGALVAAALVGFLFLRRKARADMTSDDEEEVTAFSEPQPEPHPVPVTPAVRAPAPAPAPTPAPAPAPVSAEPARARGELGFDPLQLRLSLVYATLRYRLALKAVTAIPPAHLLGDMIGAHGSLGEAEQLFPPATSLARLGAIPRMAPGETIVLEGEIRLPLSEIRPVQQGGASFFVPLVRLALLTDESHAEASPDLPHLELGCVFTVGIPGANPGIDTILAPLRTDTGPRDFTMLDVREVASGRRTVLLPLDPVRAAS